MTTYKSGNRIVGTSAERVALTSETPAYEDDFSSSTGWTQVNSWVAISGGVMDFTGGSNADHRIHKSLGLTLNNTKFVMRFKYRSDGSKDIGYIVLSSGTTNPDSNNTDYIGFYPSNTQCFLAHADSGALQTSSSLSISDSVDYYIEIIRESATAIKLSIFSDSGYSSLVSEVTDTIPSTVQGLTNIIGASITGGGDTSGVNWYIDDLKVYDGVTTVSKTLNIENNYIFEETDTGKHYLWNSTTSTWTEIA